MTAPALAAWLTERFDAEFAAELLAEFRSAGRVRVVEARTAAVRGDAVTVERATHTLGSMALTVGFQELGSLCRVMEARIRASGLAAVELPPLEEAFAHAEGEAEGLERSGLLATCGN